MTKGARQRAVVVELQARKAVVLTKDGRFLKVARQTHRLGEETWVTVPQDAFVPALRWGTVAAALALVVAVMGRALPGAYAATVAYVSVQIDPGVTLGVASNGTVTAATAQDRDAALVLNRLNLIGESLPKAVTAIVDSSLTAGLVRTGHWIAYVVTVYPANGLPVATTLRKEVAQAEISGQRALAAAHVSDTNEVLAVSAKVAAAAQAQGVPVGTYAVYLQLQKVSPTPPPLSALAGQGLTQGIVQSGDQAAFEQEVEDESTGSSPGQAGSPGQGNQKSQASQPNQMPEGVENLLPSVLPGSGGGGGGGSDSPGQGDGQGKNQDGSSAQGSKSQSKSDQQAGSSDSSGGAVSAPQPPSGDGSLLPSSTNSDSTSGGSSTDSTSGGSSSTQQGSDGGDSSGSGGS